MEKKIKAVIFDMDGVIVDSEFLWVEAEQRVFSNYGINMEEWMCKKTKGMRLDEVVDYWCSYFQAKVNKRLLVREIETEMIKLIAMKGFAIEGLKELLSYLNKKYILGLASSSNKAIISAVIKKLKLENYFLAIESAQDLTYGKPHPEVFINTAKSLRLQASDCIVIEDSFHGIIAAIAAKMKVIGLAYNEPIKQSHFDLADYSVDHLSKIINLL